MLQKLRDEKLPQKLVAKNTTRFTVDWTGKEGIDETSHRAYFETFCEKFYNDVTNQISEAMAKHVKLANDPVYNEPLQHLHACRNHVSAFQVRRWGGYFFLSFFVFVFAFVFGVCVCVCVCVCLCVCVFVFVCKLFILYIFLMRTKG